MKSQWYAVLLVILFAVLAQADDAQLLSWTCTPDLCRDVEFGIYSGQVSVSITGLCGSPNYNTPSANSAVQVIACSYPVALDAEAVGLQGSNATAYQWGFPYWSMYDNVWCATPWQHDRYVQPPAPC